MSDQLKGRTACGPLLGLRSHGARGNAELKLRPNAQYQVAVLQVVDRSFPDHSIEEIENWWKRKLMTREHGLNRN